MAKVKLTLAKSLIGRKKNQILTANSLGLKKIGDTVVSERDNILEGKLNVIAHLVKVEEAEITLEQRIRGRSTGRALRAAEERFLRAAQAAPQ